MSLKMNVLASIENAEVPCFFTDIRYDEKEFVIGRKDGSVSVHKLDDSTITLSNILEVTTSSLSMPVTSCRYLQPTESNKLGNTILAADGGGNIRMWHTSSGQLLHSIYVGEDSPLNCMDVSGSEVVVGGYDCLLHLYDLLTFTEIRTFGRLCKNKGYDEGAGIVSHSSRIFSSVFSPSDHNIIVSGGWDKTVIIWDQRQQRPIDHIYGPEITGDGISFNDDGTQFFTASNHPSAGGLQCWDFATRKLVWEVEPEIENHLYSTKWAGENVIACGTKPNEVLIVDTQTGRVIKRHEFEHALFDLTIFSDFNRFLVCGDHVCSLVDITTSM
eukprot:m.3754 g.3754  ORF g.3754 m.3754 type:complete len:329 (-) comp2121_c0_seq1:1255-2241(-)